MRREILRLTYVTVESEGEVLLDNIILCLFQGEIMGLLAAEAKGKEELISLIRQNSDISYGRIYYNNELKNSFDYSDKSYNKVYIIDQKGGLVPDLTVTDNIFVLRRGFKKYLIRKKVLREQLKRKLKDMHLEINVFKPINRLTPLERCLIELIKAEISNCAVIILTDLSNFLSPLELSKFQDIIRKYCTMGYSFIYVGNHHEELFRICDRVALLKGGRIVKLYEKREMTDSNIRPFIANSFGETSIKRPSLKEKNILEFRNVATNSLSNMSFSIKKGECVVLLDMNNTSLEDIRGLILEGKEIIKGEVILNKSPYTSIMSRKFLDYKVAVIEDNPTKTMIFKEMTYLENLTFLTVNKLNNLWIRKRYLKSVVKEYKALVGEVIEKHDIKDLSLQELYELVYYRIHLFNPEIVLSIKPFAKGDMLCRNRVIKLIEELKSKGISVMILTVSLSDSLEVADRLLILENGKNILEYSKENFEELKASIYNN